MAEVDPGALQAEGGSGLVNTRRERANPSPTWSEAISKSSSSEAIADWDWERDWSSVSDEAVRFRGFEWKSYSVWIT